MTGTATPGTIPWFPPYQPGALPFSGNEILYLVSNADPSLAASYRVPVTDVVGKAPGAMPNAVPTSSDMLAFLQKSTGLPASCQVGSLGQTFGNLPVAGATSQILAKNSGTNYDASWVNLSTLATASTGLFVTGTSVVAIGIATGGVNSPQIATNAVGNIQIRQGQPLSVVGIAGNATANVADIVAAGGGLVLQSNAGGTGLVFAAAATGTLPGPYQTGTLTKNAVLVGNGTSPIAAAGTTSIGLPLLSNGTLSLPSFGVLNLTGGGTGTTNLTVHGVLIGAGTSTIVASSTQTAGQLLVGQNVTADPSWQTITGDLGLTAGGVATVSNNAITFGKFQQVNGLSVVGVTGNATANVAAVTGSNGQVLKIINATTLAFTTLPAAQITSWLTSNGTFTTPVGAAYLKVTMVGPSGGSAGSGGAGVTAGGAATGDTTFSAGALVLTAGKGSPGTINATIAQGGTATGGDINIVGMAGAAGPATATAAGGMGGVSFFGGAGPQPAPGAANGNAPAANSGSGASGASALSTTSAGGGSAAGGFVYKIIAPPAVSYTWQVGLAGAAGTSGTNGFSGAAGSNGLIIVETYFQ